MHILTWNINGLRAVLAKAGQTLDEFLAECDADIICFQETKLTRSEMTEALACPKEFDAFYSFSRAKKGYSGVATFVRTSTRHTLAAETNLCPFQEGRLVVTVHGEFVVINVYCPATAGDVERKMKFHTFFTSEITRQRQSHPNKPFIIVGDLNVIHKPIDDCADYIECEATEWLDALLKDTPLVDAFRHFHPTQEKAFTCWRALTGARETNYGVRIDYILVDEPFLRNVGDDCWLWTSKVGSDHCPVILRLKDLEACGEPTSVPTCAKFFPEFAGIQQKLHSFLQPQKSPPAVKTQSLSSSTVVWKQKSVASFFRQPSRPRDHRHESRSQGSTSQESTSQESLAVSVESIYQLTDHQNVAASWKALLPGKAPPAPLCSGHQLPCVLRTVLKRNDNYGRKFYLCSKPEGAPGDLNASCNHFEWANKRKRSSALLQ